MARPEEGLHQRGQIGIEVVSPFLRHHLQAGSAAVRDPDDGDDFLAARSPPATMAGHSLITAPADQAFGLPIGITFTGRAWSEPVLIWLAGAYEQASRARRVPGSAAERQLLGGR